VTSGNDVSVIGGVTALFAACCVLRSMKTDFLAPIPVALVLALIGAAIQWDRNEMVETELRPLRLKPGPRETPFQSQSHAEEQ
jgi:hypothetical protein